MEAKMKTHQIKDEKTKELAVKYPSYREYKSKGAKEGGWGMSTIERRYGSWNAYKLKIGLETTPQHNPVLSAEELISFVKEYKTIDAYRAFCKEANNAPAESQFYKVFGSWTQARIAAGLPPSSGNLDSTEPTTVYLVWFVEDDVFKVGVTQRSVQQRFASTNLDYHVVDSISCSMEAALLLEKEILNRYKNSLVYFDKLESNGATECFRLDHVPSLF
jgi:hypothetical protein